MSYIIIYCINFITLQHGFYVVKLMVWLRKVKSCSVKLFFIVFYFIDFTHYYSTFYVLLSLFSHFFPTTVSTLRVSLSLFSCFPVVVFHFTFLLSLFSRFFPTTVSTLQVSLSLFSCFPVVVFHFTGFTHYYHAFMLSFSTLRVSLIIMFYLLLSRLMLLFSTLQVSITTTDFPVTMSIEH